MDQGFGFMQENYPKNTSKVGQKYIESNEEQHIFNMMSWPAQSADLYGMNLTEKSELNNPQEPFTSGNSCRKYSEQNNCQYTSSPLVGKYQESVKQW